MNIDPQEVHKFDQLAAEWWNPQGQFKTLHDINPLRLQFIEQRCPLVAKKVVDVGCGGGLLSESLTLRGAEVTGIDMSLHAIHCAQNHANKHHLKINYQQISVEEIAVQQAEQFDIVVCMELLEHVPNPASLVQACAQLVKPGGQVFFSTINRNPKAYLLSVIAAEYILKLLPRGTHDYQKFIKPSELDSFCRAAGLLPKNLCGLHYNPLTKNFKLSHDVAVNYLLHAVKFRS